MIIAAPPPVSTEPSPHIIRTIGYSRPLRIVFSAAQPQLPHRLCHNFPQIRMQTLISPRIAQSTQTARPRKPQKPGKKKTNGRIRVYEKKPSSPVSPPPGAHSAGWWPDCDPFLAGLSPYSSISVIELSPSSVHA